MAFEGPIVALNTPGAPAAQAVATTGSEAVFACGEKVPGADSYEVQLFRNDQWLDLPGDGVEIAYYGAGAIISQLNHDGSSY